MEHHKKVIDIGCLKKGLFGKNSLNLG